VAAAAVVSLLVVAAALGVCWKTTGGLAVEDLLLTRDQQAARLYRDGEYRKAAETFEDPYWKAASLYRAGDFKGASGIWAGLDSPEASFNLGNAEVMLGHYEEAVTLYRTALETRPGWPPAEANLRIAEIRAERLKEKLGEGTGGKLPPDKVVFGKGPKNQPGGQPDATPMSDGEIQATWLRRVQPRPAEFLRLKFAQQAARQKEE